MLISLAHAQDAASTAVPAASPLAGILPLVLIFVVFYFLLIRPQQRKFKNHQLVLNAIKKGDKVILGGGLYGVVTKVENDNDLMVEIAPGVTVKVARATIATVVDENKTAGKNGIAASPSSANDNG